LYIVDINGIFFTHINLHRQIRIRI